MKRSSPGCGLELSLGRGQVDLCWLVALGPPVHRGWRAPLFCSLSCDHRHLFRPPQGEGFWGPAQGLELGQGSAGTVGSFSHPLPLRLDSVLPSPAVHSPPSPHPSALL